VMHAWLFGLRNGSSHGVSGARWQEETRKRFVWRGNNVGWRLESPQHLRHRTSDG
jgi:hypothetical protein